MELGTLQRPNFRVFVHEKRKRKRKYVSANTNRLVRYNNLVQLRAVVHAAGNPLSLCYTALYVPDVYMYIRIMLAEKET